MQQSVVKTPSGTLEYTVAHRPRVTRRLHLELDEQGGLVIVAPKHWSKAYISAMLAQNTGRVARFLATARQRRLPPLQYVQGEQHLYLGAPYALVIEQKAKPFRVIISSQKLHVVTKRSEPGAIKSALNTWYRQQAMTVFTERIQHIAQQAPWAVDRTIPLKLRSMRRTWGNCSAKGVIKLNTHLIKTPFTIVDAVIAHELCHLEEMNHSRAFYALLEGLNPNWRHDRKMLRSQGHLYLRS